MKKIVGFLIFLIISVSVVYDMKVGSLPSSKTETTLKNESISVTQTTIPYQEVKIKGGDTVLSITEHLHNQALPVSIEQVISDFEKLNNGMAPEDILIGGSYKIPVYE
ncbi:ketopantoate hydroxymethyltransferase [Oikeobacillus pervagus]|uniref:Ketopantoate hydroxymethyltransferase n=1 Tax=Oikeobacillus pervagus TaxID=1325931 RepID=A0AAJ1WI09_9BACI|nr:hypothetical protein [Oikeobacillus pervagus]MDQ0213888.1 ketopantoate hydroxymethyltransferase [Oikeobacillus pervagus]